MYEWMLMEHAWGVAEIMGMTLATRLVGYQPQFFPRLHYYARVLNADVFVISDYVQYVRKHVYPREDGTSERGPSYQAHTPVKTPAGVKLIDVPVKKGGVGGRQPLNEAKIEYGSPWNRKALNQIDQYYRKAPRFASVFPSLSEVLLREYGSLAELSIASFLWGLSEIFELDDDSTRDPTIDAAHRVLPYQPFRLKQIIRVSETGVPPADKEARDANDWLIEQCRFVGAEEYYFGGTSASAYMDFERFEAAGIRLVKQEWSCEPYPQMHGAFIPNLSIIDLVMHVPPAEARRILHTPESADG